MAQSLDPEFEEKLFLEAARKAILSEIDRPLDGSAGSDRAAAASLRRGLEERRKSFENVFEQPFERAFEIEFDGKYTVFHIGRQHVVVGEDLIIDFRADLASAKRTRTATEIRAIFFKEDEIVRVEVAGKRRGAGLKSLEMATPQAPSEESQRPPKTKSKATKETTPKRRRRDRDRTVESQTIDEPAQPVSISTFVDAVLSDMVTSRDRKMSDIVATIQADQDAMMRLPTDVALAIEGGPGTGKTVVGLHRLAFVAYEGREGGSDQSLLMIGPSDQFVDYVKNVLYRLGERQVIQTSFNALCLSVLRDEEQRRVKLSIQDSEMGALAKSTSAVFRVLRFMLLARVRCVYVQVKASGSIWIAPEQLEEFLVNKKGDFLDGKLSMKSIRDDLANWLFRYCGESRNFAESSDRARRSGSAKQEFESRKAAGENVELVSLGNKAQSTLRDETTTLAERLVPDDEALTLLARFHDPKSDVFAPLGSPNAPSDQERFLREVIVRGENATSVSARRGGVIGGVDLPLLHELELAIRGNRKAQFGHVMVDEAQDLTPAMVTVIRRYVTQDRITLLGDFNQRTRHDAVESWSHLKHWFGLRYLDRAVLAQSYRVPKPALEQAAKILSPEERRLAPVGVRSGEAVEFRRVPARRVQDEVARVIKKASEGQILVVASEEFAESFVNDDQRTTCVQAARSNGLEAGLLIVVEPTAWTSDSNESRHLLYVALTRTMSRLVIVHSEELPFGLTKPKKRAKADVKPRKRTISLSGFMRRRS